MADPNKKTEFLVETSGNRHQAGAMRVKLTITHRLTFDIKDANAIVALLKGESIELTLEQQEVADFIKAQIEGQRRLNNLIESIHFQTKNAELHNNLSQRKTR